MVSSFPKVASGFGVSVRLFLRSFQGGVGFIFPEVVEGEVADAAEEPRAGVFDFCPVRVEAEEGFLDDVLGVFPLAGEAVGIAKEGGFLGSEDLAESRFFLHVYWFSERGKNRDCSGAFTGGGAGGCEVPWRWAGMLSPFMTRGIWEP